ncbi:MAG: MFS transporter [Verrucomicrobia bacterium]|nr:MFS transporter [Verrucomicrobiota bacterium]
MTPPPTEGRSLLAGDGERNESPASRLLPQSPDAAPATALRIILAVSAGHLLNDTIQSLLPAIYPLLKAELGLTFAQIGLITLAFQLTASLLQPLVGIYTDHRPQPFSLAIGMVFTLVGVVLLSLADTFAAVLGAAALVGLGSSVFHPEASRVARLASGGRHGFAQSLFQVGGNAGSALGPLLAAVVLVHRAQSQIAWFALVPLAGIALLARVGRWYRAQLAAHHAEGGRARPARPLPVSRGRVIGALAVLIVLIFSKYFYLACLGSYYTFFLIHKFAVSVREAQLYLFLFLAAVAGTIIGGPVGDRFGRKYVIWGSILGVAPFTIALPYANLFWTGALSVVIGVVLASAFSAIIVYAQELIPSRVGLVSGLFFGFAFGLGGIGSALLGWFADHAGIDTVYHMCSFLPLLGLLTVFLPQIERPAAPTR